MDNEFDEGLIPLKDLDVQELQIEEHVLRTDLKNPDFTPAEKTIITRRLKETIDELASR